MRCGDFLRELLVDDGSLINTKSTRLVSQTGKC